MSDAPSILATLRDFSTRAGPTPLGPQLVEVETMLTRRGQLGLLTISVLEREGRRVEDGWAEYERTLRSVAAFLIEHLRQEMRRTDLMLDPLIAGNTFVLFLSPPREGRALDLIDVTRVRHRLQRRLQRHLNELLSPSALQRFGVYIGGALLRHDPSVDHHTLIYRSLESAFADALNQQRAEGRGQLRQLRRILRSERLRTVYQPVVDLAERRVVGLEALTRVHSVHFPTPDLLFKVAHENGALWEIERLSRRRALEGVPALEPTQLLFLNIEPDSIHDPELTDDGFLLCLARAGLRPEQLVLEMTEHAAVKDFGSVREALSHHRRLGYRLAMDDVGSGYAGLQSIAELRPDFLKVDMTLVRDMQHDPIKRELISTIRRFTDRTGSVLVAEGVEHSDELASLLKAGVRCAQGYLFARPQAPPEQPDWSALEALATVASR